MGHIVDISKWNGNINWDVAAPQLDLAICRVQYGSNKVDEWYQRYVAKLEQHGVPHAAYAYGCYISINDAIVEADDFMARTSPNAKFLVLDVEDDTLQSCGANNLAKASQAFIDRCKSRGWKVGLYVSHHMYNKYGLNGVKADFLWIPRYGGNKPSYPCDIWQYTETGNVPGIGKCDLNSLIGNKSLSWFTESATQESVQASTQNIIQSGAFSPYETPDVMGALTSLKMTANFFLKPNGETYFISEPTSDAQLKAMKEYLDRKGWWYEDK
ncbi:N-acetylmuramoyl-L-alanine amidase [Bacillus cereus]|nr:N-acetylmuramoyl-L-alanine amidase [Bacillus cereus]